MKVMLLAELCGVSVRTVRHYHAAALLPIPPIVGGVRNYGLAHVARLTRIRWLADSGLTLAQVGDVLRGDEGSGSAESVDLQVVADLQSALTTLESRLVGLEHQRDRLSVLLASVADGGSLTPLPAVVASFYAELDAAAADETTRRAVREERDFLELAYFRGQVPPEAEVLFLGATTESVAQGLEMFAVGHAADALSEDDIEQLAAANIARIRSSVGHRLPELAASIDLEVLAHLYELYDKTADQRGRRLGREMQRQLTNEIQAWRSG